MNFNPPPGCQHCKFFGDHSACNMSDKLTITEIIENEITVHCPKFEEV